MATAQATLETEAVYIDPSLIIRPSGPSAEVVIPLRPNIPITPRSKQLVVNIETLGLYPWESRIIAIGMVDAADLNAQPLVLMVESEREMLLDFFKLFRDLDYTSIVAYNASFDFRFIIARAMLYGFSCKEFQDADIIDVMRCMTYGRLEYTWGNQKSGRLDQWTDLYYGFPKPFDDLEMMKLYEQGEWELVYNYAAGQVLRAQWLYNHWLYTVSNPTSEGPPDLSFFTPTQGIASSAAASSNLTINLPQGLNTAFIECQDCLARTDIAPGEEVLRCPVCGSSNISGGAS